MISRIPLNNQSPYQRFSVQLSNRLIEFELRWLVQYEFYAVNLYEAGVPITLGRGLHPGVNIVKGLNSGLGAIYLEGQSPTIENLGINNRLLYDDEGADE